MNNNSKFFISYGTRKIEYELFRTERKSLEIAVLPDCSVVVKAPIEAEILAIETRLKKRARWIIQQQNYFGQFNPKTPNRKYLMGETHLYLGKQYRLKISVDSKNSVKLVRGYFQIRIKNEVSQEVVKRLLDKWYLEKAGIHFKSSLERCWKKFELSGFEQPEISIRKMEKRWGSLSNQKQIILNRNLIKASKECIDYVVTHELCHLKYRDHSPEFYKFLESIIPNWEKIKHKLELSLI